MRRYYIVCWLLLIVGGCMNENIVKDEYTVETPDYYADHEIERGDIIYYHIPSEAIRDEGQQKKDFSRVVALEGERISIRNAQIYINGQRLDTFYGRLLAYGNNEKEWSATDMTGCDTECQKTFQDYYKTDMKEVDVPDGSLFILGDNSIRSLGSLQFGSLPESAIIGKVRGLLKE